MPLLSDYKQLEELREKYRQLGGAYIEERCQFGQFIAEADAQGYLDRNLQWRNMKKKIFVYLAGPITDRTKGEANDWRDMFSRALQRRGEQYVGVSPLRCEPLVGERYGPGYSDLRFGTPTAIQMKNFMDVEKADIVVAYIPKRFDMPSLGTLAETQWAFALRKPCILVTSHPALKDHPVYKGTISWIFPEECGENGDGFHQALDTIEGLFEVYSR